MNDNWQHDPITIAGLVVLSVLFFVAEVFDVLGAPGVYKILHSHSNSDGACQDIR